MVIVLPEHQTERIGTNLSLPYRLASNRREGLQKARGNCITTILRDSDLLYTVLAFLHSSTEPLGLISQHLAGVERGERGYFSLALYYRHSSSLPPWDGICFAPTPEHMVSGAWFGLVLGAFCVLFSSFLPVIPDYERVTTLIFLLDLYLFIIQFFLFISLSSVSVRVGGSWVGIFLMVTQSGPVLSVEAENGPKLRIRIGRGERS